MEYCENSMLLNTSIDIFVYDYPKKENREEDRELLIQMKLMLNYIPKEALLAREDIIG